MSGGHFGYGQHTMNSIADEVERLINTNGSDEVDEWGDKCHCNFSEETINEFRKGLEVLRSASIYAHRIDWLVSGDDGEDTFHERLKEELKSKKTDELKDTVHKFFTVYLNRVEESDGGRLFNPITIGCCRVMMVQPLGELLERMRVLSGASPNPLDRGEK